MKIFYTTFDIARFCGVAHTTVIRWIEEEKLRAYETPGGHRRIHRADLLAFMKQYRMKIPDSLAEGLPLVLAIDDEPGILSLIKKAFRSCEKELEVRTCSNGVDALLLMGKNPPDLVILDIFMPEMDGISLCKRLKTAQETSHVKIVAITGKPLSDEQESYLSQNADLVLRKPFSPLALVEKTRKLLGLGA